MRRSIFFALLLAVLSVPALPGYVLLTNGVPTSFLLPGVSAPSILFNGDLGYAVYVPPGASSLTIDLDSHSIFYDLDLIVRYNAEPGCTGLGCAGPLIYDYRTVAGAGPTKEIVITPQGCTAGCLPGANPPLKSGTYYMGFIVNSVGFSVISSLTATVAGGSVTPVHNVAISTFDKDLDGWTANSADSGLPGASQGDPAAILQWQSSNGNPGGFAELFSVTSNATSAYVAPQKFLGNLGALTDPYFSLDFMQISGGDNLYHAEVRIFGAGSAFSWQGIIPPSPVTAPQQLPVPPPVAICGASNAIPISITTCAPHSFINGQVVNIAGVTGNVAANGTWTITVTGPVPSSSFTLQNPVTGDSSNGTCVGSGSLNSPPCDYTGGGVASAAVGVNSCARYQLNPITNQPECVAASNVWTHYIAPLNQGSWTRIAGDAQFPTVLSNVQRIEVLGNLGLYGGSSGLDNFTLVSRDAGPPQPVLPSNTSFSAGGDGWTNNYPASTIPGATTGNAGATFRFVSANGNPGGYIQIRTPGGANRDFFVGPDRFVGDYTGITNPQFEFDYFHDSLSGASLPVEVHLIGAGTLFSWTGSVPPTRLWTHYVVPLQAVQWQRVSGTAAFSAALANVQRIEVSASQATGTETDGLDNFWLLPAAVAPAPPALSANPSSLSFQAVVKAANPASVSVGLTSIGGGQALGFTVAASTTDGGKWLKVSAPNGTTPLSLQVSVDATGLAVGSYTGQVTVTALGVNIGPQTVTVTLTVNPQTAPVPIISAGGVVNAANGMKQVAPGILATAFGGGFAPTGLPAAGLSPAFLPGTTTLATRVQGVRVLILETWGGLIGEAPILFLSNTQINFQVPFETAGRALVQVIVDNNGVQSDPVSVQVVQISPGIFTFGNNRAAATNQDNSLNTSSNPAARTTPMTVYMTGQGVVTPSVPTGNAAGGLQGTAISRMPFPSKAWIGGVPAKILFTGLTPGLVGVLQVNLVVPATAPIGDQPLVLNLGGWTSNAAMVTIR